MGGSLPKRERKKRGVRWGSMRTPAAEASILQRNSENLEMPLQTKHHKIAIYAERINSR